MSDDLSGRTLGRYQVLERLGRGGMAEVYRAYQPSLDRYVAIKVIYPHLAGDPALLERFGREARAVAALHHPNIVQVHDFDVQNSTAFMAMEFISGPTLKAAIQSLHQRGMLLPLPVVGQIVGQLADALGYAHEQRVVHRDVKPANVLIRRRGPAAAPLGDAEVDQLLLGLGPTSVVLTDFGVARIIKDSVEHTAAGTILGSPAYMSPEQGRGERVDARSDIYSLGIVLYELLVGQVPFDADTPFAIVIKHSTAPLPPPRSLRPDLPARVEQVLLKALAKDPAERFQDAAAFGAALREATGSLAATATRTLTPLPAAPDRSRETRVVAITELRPTPAAPPAPAPPARVDPPPAAQPQQKPRRSCLARSLLILGGLAVLALLIGGAFVAGGAIVFRGLGEAGALVVPTELSLQATEAAAEGAALPIGPRPPAGPTATVDPGDPLAVALAAGAVACADHGCPGGSASEALAIYSQALAEDPDSPALLAARALLYVWWDPYTYADQARADIAAALEFDDDTATAYLARGGLAAAIAQDEPSRAQALEDFSKAIELDPALAAAYLERARFLFYAPDFYDQSSPSRDQVIADTGEVIARAPASVAALNLRAEAYAVASRHDEALADTNAALAVDPQSFEALMRRAQLYRYHYDQPAAALEDFAAAIAVDPQNGDAYEGHAAMLIRAANYQAALEDADMMASLNPDDLRAAVFHGFTLLGLDRAPEAQADFARALELAPDDIGARYGRGLALLAQEQAAAAIPDLELAAQDPDALAYIYEVFRYDRPSAQVDLARAYLAANRQDAAGPLLDAAVEANPDWYLPYLLRARYRRVAGDLAGARADLRLAARYAGSPAELAAVEQEQGRLP